MPILKWKRGEQMAVRALGESARSRMLPLVEVQDRPFDWEGGEEGSYTRTWDDHLRKVVESTVRYWGCDHEIAIDQPIGEDDEVNGNSAWRYLFESLWSQRVAAVPVISSLASLSELQTLKELRAPERGAGRYVLRFRGLGKNYDASLEGVGYWFRDTLKRMHASHDKVDAVLDIGYLSGTGGDRFASAANESLADECAEALASIALQGPWRSLTFAAGAFPENLAGMSVGVHRLPRRDWHLFRKLQSSTSKRRGLGYGDYGVSYTDILEVDPRLVRMSASLRYTHLDDWFVFKGRNVKDHGYEQYRDLCRILVDADLPFMGKDFSEGDANYFAVARNLAAGPGNATVWRRDATNHHIQVVLKQLRELGLES